MSDNPQTFADILSTVPHNIGETPTDSMVLMLIKDGYIVANLVFVMPERDMTPADAALIVGKCERVDFEHFITVAYTDRPSKCEDHPAGMHESQMLDLFMTITNGATVVGAGLVTSNYYIDFSEDDHPHRPLREIAESPTALHLAVEHSHEGAALMKLDIPEPDLADRLSTLAIDQYVKNQGGPEVNSLDDARKLVHYNDARELWERCLARDFGPTRPEAIDLIGYMQIDGLRDRLVVDVTSKTEDEQTFLRILRGEFDIHYSRARMNSAISVLVNVFQYAKPKHRDGLFIALALLEYHRGSNHDAIDYLQRVRNTESPEVRVLLPHLQHGGLAVSAQNQPLP